MKKMNAAAASNLRQLVSEEEWQTRVDLAACYRLVHHHRMTDLIYTHLTARVPGPWVLKPRAKHTESVH